jgi:hypothetical protein
MAWAEEHLLHEDERPFLPVILGRGSASVATALVRAREFSALASGVIGYERDDVDAASSLHLKGLARSQERFTLYQ